MPNPAQTAIYNTIRSEIARLRGPQSYVPLSPDRVTQLQDEGHNAVFFVNGARVIVNAWGRVTDSGLPDCPTYACGLLPKFLLPAVAADLLSRGNPHKQNLHSQSHTPESFIAYLQHGTVLDKSALRNNPSASQRTRPVACEPDVDGDPYDFVLQFQPSEVDGLIARRLTNVEEDKAFEAGRSVVSGNYTRENLNVIVAWKMEGVHLTRVMSYLQKNTDAEIAHALRAATLGNDERLAIAILDNLQGVGIPVASAILTTIHPERYTIIDIYALRSLGIHNGPTDRVDYYLAYLAKCRALAQEFKISLRILDHALWQWGFEHRGLAVGRG